MSGGRAFLFHGNGDWLFLMFMLIFSGATIVLFYRKHIRIVHTLKHLYRYSFLLSHR